MELENTGDTFNCSICAEDRSIFTLFTLSECQHSFCTECIVNYLTMYINEGKCVDLKCLQCPAHIDYADIREVLPAETFDKYEEFAVQGALKRDPNTRWCPRPGCGLATIASPQDPVITCDCGFQYCFRCREAAHDEGEMCPRDPRNTERAGPIPFSIATGAGGGNFQNVNDRNTKRCPQCDVAIQKTEGCNHVTCASCQYQFCWLCLGKYTDNHFSLTNMGGCPGMQGENFNMGRTTLIGARIGIISGFVLSSLVMLATSVTPGAIHHVHGSIMLIKKVFRDST